MPVHLTIKQSGVKQSGRMWNEIKIGHIHNDHCQTSSNNNKEIIVTSFSWVLLLKCKVLFLQDFLYVPICLKKGRCSLFSTCLKKLGAKFALLLNFHLKPPSYIITEQNSKCEQLLMDLLNRIFKKI
jgi:hypothetical protein